MTITGLVKHAPKEPKRKEYNRITDDVIDLYDDNVHKRIQELPEGSKIGTMHASKKSGETIMGTYTKE